MQASVQDCAIGGSLYTVRYVLLYRTHFEQVLYTIWTNHSKHSDIS